MPCCVIPTISHCFGCGRVLIVLVTVIVFVATMSYLNTFLSFLFFFTFHAQSSLLAFIYKMYELTPILHTLWHFSRFRICDTINMYKVHLVFKIIIPKAPKCYICSKIKKKRELHKHNRYGNWNISQNPTNYLWAIIKSPALLFNFLKTLWLLI